MREHREKGRPPGTRGPKEQFPARYEGARGVPTSGAGRTLPSREHKRQDAGAHDPTRAVPDKDATRHGGPPPALRIRIIKRQMSSMPPVRKPPRPQITISLIFLAVALAVLWFIQLTGAGQQKPQQVPYSQFLTELRAGHVHSVQIEADRVIAQLKPAAAASQTNNKPSAPQVIVATRLPGISDTALVQEMQAR